jgi:hypothetical protein
MNWLQCPNCQRLFVQYGLKEDILERVGDTCCRHCQKSGYENPLAGSLVMPTFLKDLTNFQVKRTSGLCSICGKEAGRFLGVIAAVPPPSFIPYVINRIITP